MAVAGPRRGPDSDENNLCRRRRSGIAGECKTLATPAVRDDRLKLRLVNRHFAAAEQCDFILINIDASDVLSGLRETRSRYKSDVTRANYYKPHSLSSPVNLQV
jgi:hypothetical protein